MTTQVTLSTKAELLQANIDRLERSWGRRKICAEITSCLCCPCTFVGLCIPTILCYYCVCYCALYKERDILAEALRCCQCRMFDAPPENCCQLACTFCTPLTAGDMPKDPQFYSTPPERQSMQESAKKIEDTVNLSIL